jgi:hypothetical protein
VKFTPANYFKKFLPTSLFQREGPDGGNPLCKWSKNNNNLLDRHSRSASERESSLFPRNSGSPIKTFGDDEKNPVNTIEIPIFDAHLD